MKEQQFRYHLEEYRSLKAEISARIQSAEKIEFVTVAGVVGIYAWLIEQEKVGGIWWLPVVLSVVALVRQAGLFNRMIEIGAYLRELEREVCATRPHGWETFLKARGEKPASWLISASGLALWMIIAFFGAVIAHKGGLWMPTSPAQ